MYIKECEMVKIVLNNKTQVTKWIKATNIHIVIDEQFEINWIFLKTKKEFRKLFIKVKCDICDMIHDRRIRDLIPEKDYHLCKTCAKIGERNPIYGLFGENNPNFGQTRESIKGDKNPSKRPEVREKISFSKKGTKNFLGKKHTEESKQKISTSNTGQKRSIETVEKIKKARKLQTGSRCPGWKGGITSLIRLMRNNDFYSNWRKIVFERDKYTCQICKNKGYLHAHHIIGVNENLDLIYNVDNGITLCKRCHIEFHKKYGNKNLPKINLCR